MHRNLLKSLALCLLLALIGPLQLFSQDPGKGIVRKARLAGSYYPETPGELNASLEKYFSEALGDEAYTAKEDPVRVQAIIAPRAGYSRSGLVAASAYQAIPADAVYKNIFIISSAGKGSLSGISVDHCEAYKTPLGEVKVNRELAAELVAKHPAFSYNREAHGKEHGIEVQLPFVQYHLENSVTIIPILVENSSTKAARDLAVALLPWFTPENLFIISADFSRYPSYNDAIEIDGITAETLKKLKPEAFYLTLQSLSNSGTKGLLTPCSGWSSILGMLYMAERQANLELTPLLYRNSGDVSGADKGGVVGYWGMSVCETPPDPDAFMLSTKDELKLLSIARRSLETYLEKGVLEQVNIKELNPPLKQHSFCVLNLYMGDRLRGSMANFDREQPLWLSVQELCLGAALNDSRFAPVHQSELDYLKIEIATISSLIEMKVIDDFEQGMHGIYMTSGERSGVLFPYEYEKAGNSKEQILEYCAMEKLGLGPGEWKEVEVFLFETRVFREP